VGKKDKNGGKEQAMDAAAFFVRSLSLSLSLSLSAVDRYTLYLSLSLSLSLSLTSVRGLTVF
jgi:hypothetical protein